MSQIRLILVDDHRLFTQGLAAALAKNTDMEILATFSDAGKALQALRGMTPDLLITDISMPNMNGVEFIKKAKKNMLNLKILVVSMFKIPHSIQNIDGYLSKDTDINTISEVIREIVLNDKKYVSKSAYEKDIAAFSKRILTRREKEIVLLIAQEFTVNEIAAHLFISKLTVESHKKNIFYKLNVNTNAGLVKKALQLGFL